MGFTLSETAQVLSTGDGRKMTARACQRQAGGVIRKLPPGGLVALRCAGAGQGAGQGARFLAGRRRRVPLAEGAVVLSVRCLKAEQSPREGKVLREGTSVLRVLFSVFFPSDASWGFLFAPRSLQGTLRCTTWGPCVQQGE